MYLKKTKSCGIQMSILHNFTKLHTHKVFLLHNAGQGRPKENEKWGEEKGGEPTTQ